MRILALLLMLCFLNGKSQRILPNQYHLAMYFNDLYPANAEKLLNDNGFTLISQSKTSNTVYNLTYTLRAYDEYYYYVDLSKRGGILQISIMFNNRSKAEEFEPLNEIIKKTMEKLPPPPSGNNNFTYYQSGSFYCGVCDYKDGTYMITFMNYAAFHEYHEKVLNKDKK